MPRQKTDHPTSFRLFIIALILLICGGMVILFSASSRIAFKLEGDANLYFESHLKYLIISLLAGICFFLIDFRKIKKVSFIFVLTAFAALLYMLIYKFSHNINSPARWFRLGGRNFFQLAELTKFAVIIYISAYVSNHKENLTVYKKGLLPALAISLILIGMIALTPDFSSALSLFIILIVTLYISGASPSKLLTVSGIMAVLGAFFVWFSDYRRARILAFFNSSSDIGGGNYQIQKSLISLSGGKLFGRGFGNSTGKNLFLPEAHTDFIFSIAGEELGFITTFTILVLFVIFFISMMRMARDVRSDFGKTLIFATAFSIIYYALMNAAVCVKLGPVTGLPMPFISKSGSQLMVNMSLLGICMNVYRQTREDLSQEELERVIYEI